MMVSPEVPVAWQLKSITGPALSEMSLLFRQIGIDAAAGRLS